MSKVALEKKYPKYETFSKSTPGTPHHGNLSPSKWSRVKSSLEEVAQEQNIQKYDTSNKNSPVTPGFGYLSPSKWSRLKSSFNTMRSGAQSRESIALSRSASADNFSQRPNILHALATIGVLGARARRARDLKPLDLNRTTPVLKKQRSRKHLRKPKSGKKFKSLCKFLILLFGLVKYHASKVFEFLEKSVEMPEAALEHHLMFDVTKYSADKTARVSQETIRILEKTPSKRTEEEIRHVRVALGNYPTIAEYPLRMQILIAKRAWYSKFEEKRVIIREGHPAKCFYIILSGSVFVTKFVEGSKVSKTVCTLKRGAPFGELGIADNRPRAASIVTKETVQLLVLGDTDYIEIFMSGGLGNPKDEFLGNLSFLEDWPLEMLRNQMDKAFQNFVKKNTVLVIDSNCSEWIFIVKSGVCAVVKALDQKEVVQMMKKEKRAILGNEDFTKAMSHQKLIQSKLAQLDRARAQNCPLVVRQQLLQDLSLGVDMKPITNRSEGELGRRNSRYGLDSRRKSRRNTMLTIQEGLSLGNIRKESLLPDITVAPSLEESDHDVRRKSTVPEINTSLSTEDAERDIRRKSMVESITMILKEREKSQHTLTDELNEEYKAKELAGDLTASIDKPIFIMVESLREGSVFGLQSLVCSDQPSLSLYSLGAELIIINKKFYLEHLPVGLMKKLVKEVSPYPTEEEMLENFRLHMNWEQSKEETLKKIYEQNHFINRQNVEDARSGLQLRVYHPPIKRMTLQELMHSKTNLI